MRLAPSLHRLGEDIVCCYLVEEAGEVTIIDAGVPAYYAELTTELAAMARTIEDVRALVLTHAHEDHIGFAERLRADHAVPVSIHELDVALARSEVGNPSAGMGERRLRSLLH
jgi:glyoxylase-like metal-dependent hydrolase (beta-lactamase superfamily II)